MAKNKKENMQAEEAVKEKDIPIAECEEPIQIDMDGNPVMSESAKQAEEYKNMLQRLQAEFDNFRKRNNDAVRISRNDGINDVVTALFPALDNIERAIAAFSDESLRSGSELILKQIKDVLAKFDVAEIDALGQDFNPEFHYAIEQEENPEMENKVTYIFQKGYQRKGKVLRCAMVKVAR